MALWHSAFEYFTCQFSVENDAKVFVLVNDWDIIFVKFQIRIMVNLSKLAEVHAFCFISQESKAIFYGPLVYFIEAELEFAFSRVNVFWFVANM